MPTGRRDTRPGNTPKGGYQFQTQKTERVDNLLATMATTPGSATAAWLNQGQRASAKVGNSYPVFTPQAGWTYYGNGNQLRAYQDVKGPVDAIKTKDLRLDRSDLMINKDGKQDLTNAPQQMTAEQALALQKNRNKFRGRASFPVSTAQGGAPTIGVNITPGVSGINFG